MKNLILKHAKVTGIAVFLIIFTSLLVYAFPGGITGRTLKTTNSGCSCHNNQRTTDVGVSFAGPDTVISGQTAMFSLTVSKQSKTGAGLDIATRNGTLAAVSNNIHLSSGELTHNSNIPMNNGSVTVQFNYTAPSSGNIDTLWATGLATNSNGHTNGDDWNWATSKRIIIGSPSGVKNLSGEVPGTYALEQNYPNPFNPTTKINFSLPKSTNVRLAVYDMNGREVEVLVNRNLQAGIYEADWHPVNLSSGIYFYTLKTNDFTSTRKMIFVK